VEDSFGRGYGSQRTAMAEEEGMLVFSQSLSRARATKAYTYGLIHKVVFF